MATPRSSVTVTQRKVKNVSTRIDMNVPSYVSADSPRNVKYFRVVVISSLPNFKLEEHSEDDTVQFMVQRDYEAFEKLQKDLIQQFPNLKIPMPRKYYMFINEEDLEDRRVSFDCFLAVVAKNKEISTSIPVLIFLGVDLLADRKYAKRRQAYLKKQEESVEGKMVIEDQNEELFSLGSEKKLLEDDEFEEDLFKDPPKETSENLSSVKVSLLNDDICVDAALLVGNDESKKNDSIFQYQEDNELNQITDSLDDDVPVVPVVKKKTTSSNNKGTKKAIIKDLFDDVESNSGQAASMNANDVLNYIKQNQSSVNDDDDDLSLF